MPYYVNNSDVEAKNMYVFLVSQERTDLNHFEAQNFKLYFVGKSSSIDPVFYWNQAALGSDDKEVASPEDFLNEYEENVSRLDFRVHTA